MSDNETRPAAAGASPLRSATTPAGEQTPRDVSGAAALPTGTRWTRLEHFAEATSTQDVALALLADGATSGLVVVADRQTSGRGRRNRRWWDEALTGGGLPANLAMSCVINGNERDDHVVELVPLATGCAVVAALRGIGVEATLKWPNDVLIDEQKVAGILIERHTVGGETFLIVGCGINLDWRDVPREQITRDVAGDLADAGDSRESADAGADAGAGEGVGASAVEGAWVSLAEVAGTTPEAVDRDRLLSAVLTALDETLGWGRDQILATYRNHCVTLGRVVRVVLPDGRERTGVARDIDEHGRLELEPDGDVIAAGDVVHVRAQ